MRVLMVSCVLLCVCLRDSLCAFACVRNCLFV